MKEKKLVITMICERFAHINETGLSAAKKLPVSVYNTCLAIT